MLNHAIEWEWLAENPTEKIKPLRGEKKRLRFLRIKLKILKNKKKELNRL